MSGTSNHAFEAPFTGIVTDPENIQTRLVTNPCRIETPLISSCGSCNDVQVSQKQSLRQAKIQTWKINRLVAILKWNLHIE